MSDLESVSNTPLTGLKHTRAARSQGTPDRTGSSDKAPSRALGPDVSDSV